MRKWNTCSVLIMMFFFCVGMIAVVHDRHSENTVQEITAVEAVKILVIDEIELKQKEMRDTTVLVQTRQGNGSGTIIDRLETDTDGLCKYLVLTNAHVTYSRFVTILRGVDSITGKVKIERINTGCGIVAFDHTEKDWFIHNAIVIVEDTQYDFALLSFYSEHEFAVVRIASDEMVNNVRVFDEIFAMGCQLGRIPSPTIGIISQIIIGNNGEKEWVIYGSTAQITPGSSGGGLFKKYDGHYYMIGIPFRVAIAENGQIIPHLAHAISIGVARDFIDQNAVTCP